MRADDVRELLDEAAAGIGEPDLAGPAWAAGDALRRRRRRRVALVGGALAVAVVAAAIVARPSGDDKGDPVVPTTTPTVVQTVPSTGMIAGMPFWVAPKAGDERHLQWMYTLLGHRLGTPHYTPPELRLTQMNRVAAVLLRKVAADRYRPAVMSVYGRWATVPVDLEPTRDGDGDTALPLNPTAVSRDGERIAFPQPNVVVLVDVTTGRVQRIPVPSATIRQVAWMPSGDRLLASADGAAFQVVLSGKPVVRPAEPGSEPTAIGAPLALDRQDDQPVLTRHDGEGRRHVERVLEVPVGQWYGASFAIGTSVARSFFGRMPPEVSFRTTSERPQMIAVVGAGDGNGKLLILDDSTGTTQRFKGCCGVLGWYDDHTVLLESRTGRDSWILGWDTRTGQLRRVAELGSDTEAIALGPALDPSR